MKIRTFLTILSISTLITACGGGTSELPGTASTVPVTPGVVPTEPAPTEPAPTEPAPTDPAPTDPAPTDPPANTDISSESVNLNWDIPSTKVDGSPISLSDIGGYRIYEGTNENNVSMLIDISSVTTTYTVTGLSVGTHYFYVTTYDSQGQESPFSNVVQKTFM